MEKEFVENKPEEIDLISAEGVIILVGQAAFGFEPKARKKAKQYLNVLINMASTNGYANGAALLNYFRSRIIDRKKEAKLINELLGFISASEINSAFEYINQG